MTGGPAISHLQGLDLVHYTIYKLYSYTDAHYLGYSMYYMLISIMGILLIYPFLSKDCIQTDTLAG